MGKAFQEKLPDIEVFLRKRLAIYIERQRTNFLIWRQDKEALAFGRNARDLTDLESRTLERRFGSANGSAKSTQHMQWENEIDLPKTP